LAHIYIAQVLTNRSVARQEIRKANDHLKLALSLFEDFDTDGFGDPELQYDLYLTESRIRREERSYEKAYKSAEAALGIATEYDFAPEFSKAKAYVSMGEARLAQFEDEPGNISVLTDAEQLIGNALRTSGSNPAINTVAHLYEARILMKQGELHKARQEFRDALGKHGKEVQNGWVQQLAESLKKELKLPAPDFTIDLERIKEDIRRGHKKGLWDAAIRELERSMIAWAEDVSPHNAHALLDLPPSTYSRKKNKLKTD
jgi:tetratricopeptide (TPR) repeat protein